MALRIIRTGAPVSGAPVSGGSVTHGFQITPLNTGHDAYFDSGLGRTVTDSDLTVHASSVSASSFASAGGTISKHWFQGGLSIDIANVTFLACKFNQEVASGNPFTLNWGTIETPGAAGDESIAFTDYTAYRCRIGGNSDGGKINGGCSLTECYVRTEGQSAEDHNDGLQAVGSYTGNIVQRCNVDARPVNGLGAANAALFVADASSGLQQWYDNFLAGGGFVMRCYENSTYDVQGNWVLNNSWDFDAAHRAIIPQTNLTWGTVRPNLIVDAAGVMVSTLVAP